MRQQLAVALALCVMAGCRAKDTSADLPGYQVTIPPDVPQQYVVHGKDGQQFVVDGHAMYQRIHREGWADCWRRHRAGQFDPHDEALEPMAMQEPRLAERARVDGFHACRRMLLQAQRPIEPAGAAPPRTGASGSS